MTLSDLRCGRRVRLADSNYYGHGIVIAVYRQLGIVAVRWLDRNGRPMDAAQFDYRPERLRTT